VSKDKDKPVFDEQTLGKLLEAAFVLQEHNREMRELELSLELKRDQVEAQERAAAPKSVTAKPEAIGAAPSADYTLTLGRIVEIQHHIQVRHLELDSAIALVAERIVEITRAAGAAIGMIDGQNLVYRAVSGSLAPSRGASVPLEKSLCASCLKTGQILRCADVNAEFLLDAEECRRRGIASMIAVPVFHDGAVVGGLELYYSAARAFAEQDVHSCRLMAGLVTEAMARAEEVSWKKSLATERATMLEALEKIQPDLAAMLGSNAAKDPAPKAETPGPIAAPLAPIELRPIASTPKEFCRKCGHEIVGDEQFCGQCGSPRSSDYEPPTMQSKVAALWQMQEAKKKDAISGVRIVPVHEETPTPIEAAHLAQSLAHLEKMMPELFTPEPFVPEPLVKDKSIHHSSDAMEAPAELLSAGGLEETAHDLEALGEAKGNAEKEKEEEESIAETDAPAETTALASAELATQPGNWSSAASARQFLEQLASNRSPSLLRFWNTHRGDVYLAVAVILVLCVIRWGMWSSHSVTAAPNAAAAAHHKSPEAELSLFDRLLIGLGLADPPDVPEDKGDPSIAVWVDTRTALYYCPGTDLYQKTPKGKLETQREAQLDQFQPAYRKACN
jgi:putative methionine-R-sulfoxide reductase with GAF domain